MASISDLSIGDNYRRDSFSDRFCDDLCKVIVKYLPIEDKLKLELVSKQFQRNIFDGIYYLNSSYFTPIGSLYDFNLKSFEYVLKKCPNIKCFEFCKYIDNYFYINYNEIIELIVKYCKRLTQLQNLRMNQIDPKIIDKYVEKLGPNVDIIFDKIQIIANPFMSINLGENMDSVLLTAILNKFKYVFVEEVVTFRHLNELNVSNIKRLKLLYLPQDSNSSTLVVNKESLTHLEVESFGLELIDLKPLLKQISELKNLVHLNLGIEMTVQTFAEEFNSIAINCPKLKTIALRLVSEQDFKAFQTLEPLKAFKQLKRLDLKILVSEKWTKSLKQQILNSTDIRFKLFKGLDNLTHISLAYLRKKSMLMICSTRSADPLIPNICPSILTHIDSCLPNLQSLSLSQNRFTSDEGIVDILSHLKKLQSLKISFNDNMSADKDLFRSQLIQKCKKIVSINH